MSWRQRYAKSQLLVLKGLHSDMYLTLVQGVPGSGRAATRNATSIIISAGSGVEFLRGYDLLHNVRVFEAPGNNLSNLDGAPTGIVTLLVARNAITHIGNSATLCALRDVSTLDLSYNSIASLENIIINLKMMTGLRNLWLVGNMCAIEERYRTRVLAAVPWLRALDGVAVPLTTAPKRVHPRRHATVTHHASILPHDSRYRWWTTASRSGVDPKHCFGLYTALAPDGMNGHIAAALGHRTLPIIFGAGFGVETSVARTLRCATRDAAAAAAEAAWDFATAGMVSSEGALAWGVSHAQYGVISSAMSKAVAFHTDCTTSGVQQQALEAATAASRLLGPARLVCVVNSDA